MRAKKQIALLRNCINDFRERLILRLILLEQQSNQAYYLMKLWTLRNKLENTKNKRRYKMNEKEMFEINESLKFKVSAKDAAEFIEWARDKSFCNSGLHICDRLASQFEHDLEN